MSALIKMRNLIDKVMMYITVDFRRLALTSLAATVYPWFAIWGVKLQVNMRYASNRMDIYIAYDLPCKVGPFLN